MFLHLLSCFSKLYYSTILLSRVLSSSSNEPIGIFSYSRGFKKCFDAFYLSQEIQLRKPNSDIYNFVLDTHKLFPKECLFIDDTIENTETAKQLGIHIWNINPKTEDIIDLFNIRKELF